MNKKILAILIIFIMTVSNASNTSNIRLKGKNLEMFKVSYEKISKELSSAELERLKESLANIMLNMHREANLIAVDNPFINEVAAKAKFDALFAKTFDGKSIDEINADADKIIAEYGDLVKNLEEKHIEKIKSSVESYEGLKDIKILNSKVVHAHYVIFTIKVKNETKYPISHIYFHVEVKSPNRTIAWAKGDIDQSVAGGIEVNEARTLKIQPLYGWRDIPKDAKNLIIEIKAFRIDGADGKPIFKTTSTMSDDDLKKFKKTLEKENQ